MTPEDAKAYAATFRATGSKFSPETLDAIDANNAHWFQHTLPRTALYQRLRAEIQVVLEEDLANGGRLLPDAEQP